MDPLFLSRIQFGLNISFHYLFPPMSIGLAVMILIFEGIYLKTKDPEDKKIAMFWTKIFALFFAMGVATGFVQLFAFGNNWSRFSSFVGDLFGTILAAEGIFAFFLEAGFIGMMLFGWYNPRIGPKTHYFSTWMVAIGSHFSAIWILIANSWMQTPAGYKVAGTGIHQRAVLTSIWDVYTNPSVVDRIIHTLLGAWILGVFLVISVAAYYQLRNRHQYFTKRCLKFSVVWAFVLLIAQFFSADSTARHVYQTQPIKFAAMEAVYETKPYTPISVWGWVDEKKEKVVSLKVPAGLSMLTFFNPETPVPGFDTLGPGGGPVPEEDRPPVALVFQTYHIMVIGWGLMMGIILWSIFLMWRKKLLQAKWTLMALIPSIILPYISNITGWWTAEFGRQPWIVYNVLRTAQGVTPSLTTGNVIGSLIMFVAIYTLLFCFFIFMLNRKIQHGPVFEEDMEDTLYRDTSKNATDGVN